MREFDVEFKDLIDEDTPMVMLKPKENGKEKNTNNPFIKEYCEEY